MSLIEGVGDEVTVFVGILLLLIIMTLAWVSTGVADRPLQFLLRLRQVGRTVTLQNRATETTSAEEDVSHQDAAESSPTDGPAETGPDATDKTETTASAGEGQGESSSDVPSQQDGGGNMSAQSTPSSESFVHVSEVSSESESDIAQVSDVRPGVSEVAAPTGAESSVTSTTDFEQDSQLLRQRRLAFFDKSPSGSTLDQPDSTASCSTSTDQTNSSHSETVDLGKSQREQSNLESSSGTSEQPEDSESVQHGPALGEFETSEERLEGHIRIRLKYLNDHQRWVQARPEETIGQFKRLHFASELAESTVVRFIYNGQELHQEGHTLASYNVVDDSVIHCLISQASQRQPGQTSTTTPGFEIGMLMYPLFGLILGLVWYSRFAYKQYFNTVSTLTLIGVSFLFIVALMASFRTPPAHEHDD